MLNDLGLKFGGGRPYVCSLHFHPDDFQENGKLKSKALPSYTNIINNVEQMYVLMHFRNYRAVTRTSMESAPPVSCSLMK